MADAEGCYSLCGRDVDGTFVVASEVRADVTCKRCLASLAKRDRAFQRKARKHRWLDASGEWRFTPAQRAMRCACEAARAIAAEEGRAL
jgi:hypothetical protein